MNILEVEGAREITTDLTNETDTVRAKALSSFVAHTLVLHGQHARNTSNLAEQDYFYAQHTAKREELPTTYFTEYLAELVNMPHSDFTQDRLVRTMTSVSTLPDREGEIEVLYQLHKGEQVSRAITIAKLVLHRQFPNIRAIFSDCPIEGEANLGLIKPAINALQNDALEFRQAVLSVPYSVGE